jgi:hypothetical protein
MKVADLAFEAERTDDPVRLRDLSRHGSQRVRQSVAGNPAADDDVIGLLLDDAVDLVRHRAASNLAERPKLQRLAVGSADNGVRWGLAATFRFRFDRSLPYDIQAQLANDDYFECRFMVAETTNFLDLFETLLSDPEPRVRAGCAANPRVTRNQMETLVSDRSAVVRMSAAARGQVYPDDEQLLRLARDRSANVRWNVIFRVDRPREALELLAQDSDEGNRHHAQIALADNLNIVAAQGEDTVRAARREAASARPFLQPPR